MTMAAEIEEHRLNRPVAVSLASLLSSADLDLNLKRDARVRE